jgi:hypothetical protein
MVIRSSANRNHVVSSFSTFRMEDLRHHVCFWQCKESKQEDWVLAVHLFRMLFGADVADPCQLVATSPRIAGDLLKQQTIPL